MIYVVFLLSLFVFIGQMILFWLHIRHVRNQWQAWCKFAEIVHGYAEAINGFREAQIKIFVEDMKAKAKADQLGPTGMGISQK